MCSLISKLIAVAGNEGDAQIFVVGKQESQPVDLKPFGTAFNNTSGDELTSVAFDPGGQGHTMARVDTPTPTTSFSRTVHTAMKFRSRTTTR